ncbi:hypothetical protein BKA61DRAFT_677965 [Leptodontidium sp. MPI-SDFR-AT-0119]|nr:hypothetical protein BKA61DRAFT_677965 [Leptodontidium sp. MPI-SDFR-AT-0119]
MVSYRSLDPNGFTARAKRSRRGNRADNDNSLTAPVPSAPKLRRKIYNIFLSGPALEGDIREEECAFQERHASRYLVRRSMSTDMKIKTATHFAIEHKLHGKFMRLEFCTEQGAKSAYKVLMGPGICYGIIPESGKEIDVTLCISELHVPTGVDKCLCSTKKLEAEVEGKSSRDADLADVLGGLNVEKKDVDMQEEMVAPIPKPELDINGLVGAMQNWGATFGDNEDSEML